MDSSSASHNGNQRNDFLVLGERNTLGINVIFPAIEEKLSINFSKAKAKFCLSFQNSGDSYLLVKRKKSITLKEIVKILTLHPKFV